jgi:hypothetical protein
VKGVLNSGHARSGKVYCTVGDDHVLCELATFAPCAVAMIGEPYGTYSDRAIKTRMQRRLPNELVESLPDGDVDNPFVELQRKLSRLGQDIPSSFKGLALPKVQGLRDRTVSNWRPLYSIATATDPHWLQDVVDSCLELERKALVVSLDTKGVALLRDIQAAFAEKGNPEWFLSQDLCNALTEDEASPWAAYGCSEQAIKPAALAALLKPFGIHPVAKRNKQTRGKSLVLRGYMRKSFINAWDRYVSADIYSKPTDEPQESPEEEPPETDEPPVHSFHVDESGGVTAEERPQGAQAQPRRKRPW